MANISVFALITTFVTACLGSHALYKTYHKPSVHHGLDGWFVQVNSIAAIVHLSSALIIAWLSADAWQAPIYYEISVWERSNASEDCSATYPCTINTVLVEEGTLHVMYMVAAAGLVSGWCHLSIFSVTDIVSVISQIEHGVNWIQWFDYSISSSLMIVVIAVLCGLYNVYTLILLFFVQFGLMVTSAFIEQLFSVYYTTRIQTNRNFAYGLFMLSGLIYLVCVWVPIFIAYYRAVYYSMVTVPYWVGIIIWTIFGIFNGFPVIMINYQMCLRQRDQRRLNMWYQYLGYTALSLTAKIILMWMLYFGINSRSTLLDGNNSSADTWVPIAAVSSIVFGACIYLYERKKLLSIMTQHVEYLIDE